MPEVVTEIDITGANCSWCLRETLERLRTEPGVLAAEATVAGPCLRIVHAELPPEVLLDLVRRNLHAVDTATAEATMVEVDARLAVLHCTHGQT